MKKLFDLIKKKVKDIFDWMDIHEKRQIKLLKYKLKRWDNNMVGSIVIKKRRKIGKKGIKD